MFLAVLHIRIWLAGASTELDKWEAFCDITYDGGKTWSRTAALQLEGSMNDGGMLGEKYIITYAKALSHSFLKFATATRMQSLLKRVTTLA